MCAVPISSKPKKYYASAEEELWDEVNGFENDMNNMLKELSEIETTIKEGADLKEMKGLIDVTKEYMEEHFKGMDKLKNNIVGMDKQASDCLQGFLPPKVGTNGLAKIEEESNIDGFPKQRKQKKSQEQKKQKIYSKLCNIG